jgi:indole-3-glycerol-phosphate lyase
MAFAIRAALTIPSSASLSAVQSPPLSRRAMAMVTMPERRSSVMATVRAAAAVVPAAPAPPKQPATTTSFKITGASGRCLSVSQTMARLKAQGKVCTSFLS